MNLPLSTIQRYEVVVAHPEEGEMRVPLYALNDVDAKEQAEIQMRGFPLKGWRVVEVNLKEGILV